MAVKYSVSDKNLLLQILSNYKIIEDKRTDAYNIEKKRKAWENIAAEYNGIATEKRSVVQLKRAWDKIKRNRKQELASERRELMATGGGPSKPPPSPHPEIDNIIPHMEFEINVEDDSDGIMLDNNAGVSVVRVLQMTTPSDTSITDGHAELQVVQEATSEPSSASNIRSAPQTVHETTGPSSGVDKRQVAAVKKSVVPKQDSLSQLTQARLKLIKKEETQMEELHKVRMEEACYKRDAARFQMQYEEARFKKIQNVEDIV